MGSPRFSWREIARPHRFEKEVSLSYSFLITMQFSVLNLKLNCLRALGDVTAEIESRTDRAENSMNDAYFLDTCYSVLVPRKNEASMAILTRSLTMYSVKLDL